MPRAKQTAKRTRNEEVVYMEPPSDHPLFQYFSRLDDLNNYIFNFSKRIVISPRLNKVDYELDSHRLASIWNLDRVNTNDACLFDGLGYAYLWTRIFEYLGIDVSDESGRGISQNNIIDERTIHHMGRGIEESEEQQPPPPPQEQAPQEQAGPSEQPSMRDMMQVLLRIEQNQANMDTHLTRVDQRLSRIEQYLEIDEDEDQD
ncbi:hypothetical protein PIB30_102838 [Stylosanthes scabra]|uniref:Uncharacterized protein n=1 Tax=Stylosanthes scabra TaxID=79078 RepID=A0ABU6RYS8_9FABA|nr:hypothetical protein [Stylosanthes scabra]